MHRRSLLNLAAATAAALVISATHASANGPSDADAVKAAHLNFMAALSARDAKAMEVVWANKPYVVNIGPRSKRPAVGFANAVANYWPKTFAQFEKIDVTATSIAQIRTSGNLASVVGTEGIVGKTTSGKSVKFSAFVTNIFEKVGDRWLLVSHHAQRMPK